MLFLGIMSSISILLLEFIFPFVCPSEYIIFPEVCAQGWYSGSTPVLFVEFGSFFFTFFFIFSSYLCTFFGEFTFFLSNLRTFLLNLRTFLSIFVATDLNSCNRKEEEFFVEFRDFFLIYALFCYPQSSSPALHLDEPAGGSCYCIYLTFACLMENKK